MRAAREGLEAFKQQYEEAWWSWFPNARLRTIGAVIPPQPVGEPILEVVDAANGNATTDYRVLQGPDLSDWNAGLDLQVNIDLPLYTFGKLSALRDMAAAGVDIGHAAVRLARSELMFQVKRAWWGLLLSKALDEVISDGESKLKKARERLQRLEEDDDDEYDQDDSFRLRIYEARVEKLVRQNKQLRTVSRVGLREAMVLKQTDKLTLPEDGFEPLETTVGALDCYVDLASRERPEMSIRQHTIAAHRGNVDRRWGEFFPDFFLSANYTFKVSTVDQEANVFSAVSFNGSGGAAYIGLRLTMDYGAKVARYRRAKADVRKAEAELAIEKSKLRIELTQVWQAARDNRALERMQYRAMKAARSLLTSKAHLYEDGLEPMPFQEVLDASVQYLVQKSEWLQSVYSFNVGVAQLSRLVGVDVTRHRCTNDLEGKSP
jgi:outer membrane protein TolC